MRVRPTTTRTGPRSKHSRQTSNQELAQDLNATVRLRNRSSFLCGKRGGRWERVGEHALRIAILPVPHGRVVCIPWYKWQRDRQATYCCTIPKQAVTDIARHRHRPKTGKATPSHVPVSLPWKSCLAHGMNDGNGALAISVRMP